MHLERACITYTMTESRLVPTFYYVLVSCDLYLYHSVWTVELKYITLISLFCSCGLLVCNGLWQLFYLHEFVFIHVQPFASMFCSKNFHSLLHIKKYFLLFEFTCVHLIVATYFFIYEGWQILTPWLPPWHTSQISSIISPSGHSLPG